MTNDEFAYWLNGYLSLTDDIFLNKQQLKILKNHAKLVAAISGELALNIHNFIEHVDNFITEHQQISLIEIKKLVTIFEINQKIEIS